jgi:hypothetical protein
LIYSTLPGGGYGGKSGTSMAAPHVAGTAALIWATNPSWSHEQVRAQLQITADDLGEAGRDPWHGFGLVDALKAAGNTPPVATDQAVTTVENTPVVILLTASEVDSDPLTYGVVSGPTNGTLSGTPPHLTYTPHPGFSAADSFTFIANDGLADSNVATVSISVTPGTPADTVTILKASYTDARRSLTVEATSSASSGMTLTAAAYDAAGHLLGTVKMDYSAKKLRYTATLTGLSAKPYRVTVTSSGRGSASVEGAAIGGKG